MSVSIDQMRDKLLTLDEVRARLSLTEPLSEHPLTVGSGRFFLGSAWNHSAKTLDGTDRVNASVVVDGREFVLTKDALIQAAKHIGLQKPYILKTPAPLVEAHLNYWYQEGLTDKDLKMLACNGVGSAVTRATINPFSNVRLFDETVEAIKRKFGDCEILVDPKFSHSLSQTRVRFIVPSQSFDVERTGFSDDTWSIGINLSNSLIGDGQTSLDGYLFRWWCANGAIDTHTSSGKWSRRSGGQEERAVYEWAKTSVDEILGGLEGAFDSVQQMADTELEATTTEVLRDLYRTYNIIGKDREKIIENLTESGSLTMYSLMNAVTAVANLEGRDVRAQDLLMQAGGHLRHSMLDRCSSCHQVLSN